MNRKNRKLDEMLRSPITGDINMEYVKRFGATIEEIASKLSVLLGEKVSEVELKKYLNNDKNGI